MVLYLFYYFDMLLPYAYAYDDKDMFWKEEDFGFTIYSFSLHVIIIFSLRYAYMPLHIITFSSTIINTSSSSSFLLPSFFISRHFSHLLHLVSSLLLSLHHQYFPSSSFHVTSLHNIFFIRLITSLHNYSQYLLHFIGHLHLLHHLSLSSSPFSSSKNILLIFTISSPHYFHFCLFSHELIF